MKIIKLSIGVPSARARQAHAQDGVIPAGSGGYACAQMAVVAVIMTTNTVPSTLDSMAVANGSADVLLVSSLVSDIAAQAVQFDRCAVAAQVSFNFPA